VLMRVRSIGAPCAVPALLSPVRGCCHYRGSVRDTSVVRAPTAQSSVPPVQELQSVRGSAAQNQPAFVNEAVALGAEHHQVAGNRAPAATPILNVVRLEPEGIVAAGGGAAIAMPAHDFDALGRREHPAVRIETKQIVLPGGDVRDLRQVHLGSMASFTKRGSSP
jgi:hypothetical protein